MSTPSSIIAPSLECEACGIDTTITKARQEKGAVEVAYITAGFPTPATFGPIIKDLAEIFDVIEIGVPFSDPVADGPVAERLGLKAVQQGINLNAIFTALEGLPSSVTSRLVLVGYYNNFLQHGLKQLGADCQKFGITSLLIYDLPLGEEDQLRTTCPKLRLIPLLAHATPVERMQAYAKNPTPYVYFAPAVGAEGVEKALELCLKACQQAEKIFSAPAGIRFDATGIAETMKNKLPLHLYEASLLEHLEHGKTVKDFKGTI